jgi:hypothetical protein
MNIVEDVRSYNELITASFDNAMHTVEMVHQSGVDMYLGVLSELGFPSETADSLSARHRSLLRRVYGGICALNHELGELVVEQVNQVSRFADNIGVPFPGTPAPSQADDIARMLERRRREQA